MLIKSLEVRLKVMSDELLSIIQIKVKSRCLTDFSVVLILSLYKVIGLHT